VFCVVNLLLTAARWVLFLVVLPPRLTSKTQSRAAIILYSGMYLSSIFVA